MGKPAAVVDAGQRISLYVRRNGAVYGASQGGAGGAFGNWGVMGTGGSGVASDPAAVFAANGTIALYVTSSAGNVSGVN
ncbi:antibiotic ABC transporter, partial [Micromonospora sp. MW-13]|uniref:antibiotic ABC transporter n=1 Tax=Micromonospora sp. MW-13 TaxID=2094022 RepID=UPI001A9D6691